MLEWRRRLMEDYSLSPEIVVNCQEEITSGVCKNAAKGGQTIHCLMGHAMERNEQERIGAQCKIAVESLLKEADVGENVHADPLLEQACRPVINVACQGIQPGNARIMSCLMDNINSHVMNEECERRLLEINYFIARDFSLDGRLYKVCKNDAATFCSAPSQWHKQINAGKPDAEQTAPESGPLVLHCLYTRAMHPDPGSRITENCAREVKRVMRQRAVSVNLVPEVDDSCLTDLSRYCSEDTQKGAELDCLQDQLKVLDPGCREAVMQFTEMEAVDPELDTLLMKACQRMIKKYCQTELEGDQNSGDLMECLILNKNKVAHTNRKCYAGIHHFQLLSLENYKFSYKFKEACKDDVEKNCKNEEEKADVVECLSTYMTLDILKDAQQHTITKKCRSQLKVELFQQAEAIDLNPHLKGACDTDLDNLCGDLDAGTGQKLECLRQHKTELSVACKAVLFKQERVMFANPHTDFKLMTKCKKMIEHFCDDVEENNVFHCLKEHKNHDEMDLECKNLLVRRMIDQNQDFRLHPTLQKSCRLDIPKFCSKEMNSKTDDGELQGKVIACLKRPFLKNRLSGTCEEEIGRIMNEAAKDYRQNPILESACKKEIREMCLHELPAAANEDMKGAVEECLKEKLQEKKLDSNVRCKDEVIRLLIEGRADIHVDPILYRVCSSDLHRYCVDVEPGEGRQMACMLEQLDSSTVHLKPSCEARLKERVQLWEYAVKYAPPEDLTGLFEAIDMSPNRNYFIMVFFMALSAIFFGGLCCGRVTKRVSREVKNK